MRVAGHPATLSPTAAASASLESVHQGATTEDQEANMTSDEPVGAREQDATRPVVTLFEAYGSGAAYVGRTLAERLGVPYFDQKYSSSQLEEAERTNGGGWQAKLLRAIAASGVELNSSSYQLYDAPDDELVARNNDRLWEMVADGGVVLGRNATVVLASRPNSFHVKLDGPIEVRVARAAREAGIPVELARRRQAREDRARAEMSLRLYGWDPRQTGGYDVVLNTGTYDLDASVELILYCRGEAGVEPGR